MGVGGLRHGFDIFLAESISFVMGGGYCGKWLAGEFYVFWVAGVGSSSLVIDGCWGVTRSFGVLNLGVRGDVYPGVYLREGEEWRHSFFL